MKPELYQELTTAIMWIEEFEAHTTHAPYAPTAAEILPQLRAAIAKADAGHPSNDIYAEYAAERIRADQLWDIAHALQAALSRLLDSQRGLNFAEWQAATAQGRAALDKANEAETEAE